MSHLAPANPITTPEIENPIWHVVLIKFHDHVEPSVREDMLKRYEAMGERCGGAAAGILYWRIGWNLDKRKNIHFVEVALFKDQAALKAFSVHPAHKENGEILRNLADWQVGDIEHLGGRLDPLANQ